MALSDDINPELEAYESIAFIFKDVEDEIDLSAKNADKFRKMTTPYADKGRRAGERKTRTSANTRKSIDREQKQAIRARAKASGYEISERGRIPQTIMDAYDGARKPLAGGAHAVAWNTVRARHACTGLRGGESSSAAPGVPPSFQTRRTLGQPKQCALPRGAYSARPLGHPNNDNNVPSTAHMFTAGARRGADTSIIRTARRSFL